MTTGLAQELLNNRNARVGVVDVYFADELTAEDAASGWEYAGVLDPGSFSPQFNKDKFVLETGHPRTVKMEAVIRVNGALSFTLTEYNTRGLDVACGSGDPAITYATTPAATTVASATSATAFKLTSATGYAVGQMIEVDGNITYIDTLNGTDVTVKPALPATPSAADAVKAIVAVKYALGTSEIPRKAFKAVFTDQNGAQAIIYCPSVGTSGGYTPNFADATTNAKLPISLQAYGVDATWNGESHSIVGYTILKQGGGVSAA